MIKLNFAQKPLLAFIILATAACTPSGSGSGSGDSTSDQKNSSSTQVISALSPEDYASAQQQIINLQEQATKLQNNKSALLSIVSDQSSALSKIIESFIQTVLLNADSISPELASSLKLGLASIQTQIESSKSMLINSLNNLETIETGSGTHSNTGLQQTRSATIKAGEVNATKASNSTKITAEAVTNVFGALNRKIDIVIDSINQKEIIFANYQIYQMITALSDPANPNFTMFENASVQLVKSSTWINLKNIKNDQSFQNAANSGLSMVQNLMSLPEHKSNVDLMKALTQAQTILSAFQSGDNSSTVEKITHLKNKLGDIKFLIVSLKSSPNITVTSFNESLSKIELNTTIQQFTDMLDQNYATNPQNFNTSFFTNIAKASQGILDEMNITKAYLIAQPEGQTILNALVTQLGYIQNLVDKLNFYYLKSDLISRIIVCNKDLENIATVSTNSFINIFTNVQNNSTDDIVNNIMNSEVDTIAQNILSKKQEVISAITLDQLSKINLNLYELCTTQYATILNNLGQISADKINTLKESIVSLEANEAQLFEKQRNLKKEIEDLTSQLQSSLSSGNALENILASTQNDLSSKIVELQTINFQLTTVNSQLIQTQADNKILQDKLDSKTIALKNSQDQFDSLTTNYNNLQQQSSDQVSEILTLQTTLSSTQQQLTDAATQSSLLQSQLTTAQSNYNSVLDEQAELTNLLATTQSQLSVSISQNSADTTTINSLTQQVSYLTSQLAIKNQSITDLNSEISTLNTQLTVANDNINSKTALISSLQSQLTSTQSTLTTAQSDLANKQSELTTSQTFATSLQSQLSQINTKYDALLAEKMSLTSQLVAMTSQYDTSLAQNSANITVIDSLNSQIQALNTQISTLQSNVTNLTSDLSVANTKINQLNTQVTSLQSELATSQANLAIVQSNLSSSQANVTSLTSQLNTANSSLTSTQNTLSTLQSNLNSFLNSLNASLSSASSSGFISNYINCTVANFASCYSSVATAVSNLLTQTNTLKTKVSNCKNASKTAFLGSDVSSYETDAWSSSTKDKLESFVLKTAYCPTYLLD